MSNPAQCTGSTTLTWTTTAVIVAASLLALLTLSGVHAQDSGETLISNVGQSEDGTAAGLDSDVPLRAQLFHTGKNAAGYLLTSVGVRFREVDDPSPESRIDVTINRAADRVVTDPFATPGHEVCTLTHPSVYSANAVNHLDAPTGGCVLDGDGRYFVVVHRTDVGGDDMALAVTDSSAWDEDGASGWSISPHRQHSDGETWERTRGEAHMIDIRGGPCPALWCATLMVGSDPDDGSLGWAESGGPDGDLSDDDFSIGDHNYELDEIRLTTDGTLSVTFERHGAGQIESQHARDGVELYLDDLKLNLGTGDLQDDNRTVRWSTGPEWTDGQRVLLKVVEISTPPRPPESLAAVAGDGEVKLVWKTPRGGSGGSTINRHEYRQTSTNGSYGDWQIIDQSGAAQANGNSYTVSGLTNGTVYGFQVRAGNTDGLGGESNESSATPHDCDFFWCSNMTIGQLSQDSGTANGYHADDSVGALSNRLFAWDDKAFEVKWLYVEDSDSISLGVSSGDADTDSALAEALNNWRSLDFNQLELGDSTHHVGDGTVEHSNLLEGGRYAGFVKVEWSVMVSPLADVGSVSVRLADEVGGL